MQIVGRSSPKDEEEDVRKTARCYPNAPTVWLSYARTASPQARHENAAVSFLELSHAETPLSRSEEESSHTD